MRRSLTIEDVIERAAAGETSCRDAIAGIADAAGRGLGIIGSILNPGVVVVGSRGLAAGQLLLEPLEAAYERHTLLKRAQLSRAHRVRVIPARFAGDGPLMGAVTLALRRYGGLQNGT